jgi:hypothetical protein
MGYLFSLPILTPSKTVNMAGGSMIIPTRPPWGVSMFREAPLPLAICPCTIQPDLPSPLCTQPAGSSAPQQAPESSCNALQGLNCPHGYISQAQAEIGQHSHCT